MIRQPFSIFAVAMLACATSLTGVSNASQTISFPDQMTSSLVYSSIEEVNDSIISGRTFYGGVGTSGESLTFAANNFRLESTGGIGRLDARMNFRVAGKGNRKVTYVKITEGGSASVFNTGSIARDVLVGFATVNGVQSAPQQSIYTLNGSAGVPTDEPWQHFIKFTFDAAHFVDISFDNRLFVFAPPQTGDAFIDKKGVVIEVGTTVVPEPSLTAALAVAGVGAVATRRRRAVRSL